MKKKTLVVIGGGAAGFFCAINAAEQHQQLEVIILEKSSKVLSKVAVSGGGRCNVTHHCFDIPLLSKNYPRGSQFLKKAFHWFQPQSMIEWLNNHQVQVKVEKDGRMFPSSNSSETIINCFLQLARKYKIQIITRTEVTKIEKNRDTYNVFFTNQQRINTAQSESIVADFVCIASGGYPKLSQFEWLHNLNLQIEHPVPSLFTFNLPKHPITQLMGVSVDNVAIKLKNAKLKVEGPLLITHWGLSGPAVLKISALAARDLQQMQYTFAAMINWLPQLTNLSDAATWQQYRFQFGKQKIFGKNPFGLPNRLWDFLLQEAQVLPDRKWVELSNKEQHKLVDCLTAYTVNVIGKTTFKEEFVTCGGISLNQVDVNTMECKQHANLFFAGEVLDIDGVTGGFNFQNAWTTAWIAAKTIVSRAS